MPIKRSYQIQAMLTSNRLRIQVMGKRMTKRATDLRRKRARWSQKERRRRRGMARGVEAGRCRPSVTRKIRA